jgi:CheY-like chemotaxis protein
MAAGLLAKDGWEVVRFLSSEEALAACREMTGVEVVVTDLNMPGLRGEQLLAELRTLAAFATIPIFLASASAPSAEVAARCAELQGTLLAPYKLPELRKAVKGEAVSPALASVTPPGDFDPEPVQKLIQTGGNPFAAKVVGMFLAKVPASLEGLEAAFAIGDWETAERLAHSTRGSAGMVGAVRVGELAGVLEEAAARREKGSLAALRQAFEDARARLESMLT